MMDEFIHCLKTLPSRVNNLWWNIVMDKSKHYLNAHLMMRLGVCFQDIDIILSLIVNTIGKAYVIV